MPASQPRAIAIGLITFAGAAARQQNEWVPSLVAVAEVPTWEKVQTCASNLGGFDLSIFEGLDSYHAETLTRQSPEFVWTPGFDSSLKQAVEQNVGLMAKFLGHFPTTFFVFAPQLDETQYKGAAAAYCQATVGSPLAGAMFGESVKKCVAQTTAASVKGDTQWDTQWLWGCMCGKIPVINRTLTIAQVDPETYKSGSAEHYPLPFEYVNNWILAVAGWDLPWYFREGAGSLAACIISSTIGAADSFEACLTDAHGGGSNAGKSLFGNARAVYAIDDTNTSWLQVYGYNQSLPKADQKKLAKQYDPSLAGFDLSAVTNPALGAVALLYARRLANRRLSDLYRNETGFYYNIRPAPGVAREHLSDTQGWKGALLSFVKLKTMAQFYASFDSFMRLPLQEQLNELDLPSEASIRAMVAAPYVPPTDPARFPRAPSLPTCTRSHEANSATRFSGSMVHIPPGLVSMRHMRLPAKLPERELTMQI